MYPGAFVVPSSRLVVVDFLHATFDPSNKGNISIEVYTSATFYFPVKNEMRDKTCRVNIPRCEHPKCTGTFASTVCRQSHGALSVSRSNETPPFFTQGNIPNVCIDRRFWPLCDFGDFPKCIITLTQLYALLLESIHVPPDGIEPSSAD